MIIDKELKICDCKVCRFNTKGKRGPGYGHDNHCKILKEIYDTQGEEFKFRKDRRPE